MAILVEGRLFSLAWTIVILLIIFYYIRRGMQGIAANINRMPALDMIDEAVARGAEMERPVLTTVGRGNFTGANGIISLNGIEVITYASHLCARMGARQIFTCGDATVLAVAEERIKEAYLMESYQGKFEDNVSLSFHPSMAWNLATYQIIGEEKVASYIWVGRFGNETVILGEAAANVGALQVAGSNSITVISFMVASADYTMIGEEVFAAGAYLSKDPMQTNVIASADIIKYIVLGALGLFTILYNLNIPIMSLFGI